MADGMFLWARPQGSSVTETGNSGPLESGRLHEVMFNMTLVSFTGGTTPSIQFFLDVLGGDNVWYQVVTLTTALTAPAAVSVAVSDSVPDATHAVFTGQCRIRWVLGGAVPATSVAFSGSLYGRS